MGDRTWSTDFYNERERVRATRGESAFAYHETVVRADYEDRKVHDLLNPHGVAVRESRDSENHPESNAVIIGLDTTGSMRTVPVILQKQLSKLMDTLIERGYLPHPQILISAIGDATYDQAPLQMGQFESGIEIDDDLGRLWLEGQGGPLGRESYELAMYFYARHTSIDCFEKRGRKGYCFIIGDEEAYPDFPESRLQRVLGTSLQGETVTLKGIVEELKAKYHLYFIIPTHTCNGQSPSVHRYWRELVGDQNVLILSDEGAICELITMTIGFQEGKVDLDQAADDLLNAGANSGSVNAASTALSRVGYSSGGNLRL